MTFSMIPVKLKDHLQSPFQSQILGPSPRDWNSVDSVFPMNQIWWKAMNLYEKLGKCIEFKSDPSLADGMMLTN